MSKTALKKLLDSHVEKKTRVQIGLRAIGQPLGPAPVSHVVDEEHGIGQTDGLYELLQPVQYTEDPKIAPRPMLLPIRFSIDDVCLIIDEPRNIDGEKAILTQNGRTPGGLVIPGRG